MRRSLRLVATAVGTALLVAVAGGVIILDVVLPRGIAGGAGPAAAAMRALLLLDALACLVVAVVLARERLRLFDLGAMLTIERERARTTRADLARQGGYMQLVLAVAEQMVGVVSIEDLAGIVTAVVRDITGASDVVLWLVGEDGRLVRAGTGAGPGPVLYLAESETPPPPPGWAVPLVTSGRDLVGVLEIRGRARPSASVASIVEALAFHAAGAVEVHRRYMRLREASYTDPLTGLPNRWALDLALHNACDRAGRLGEPLAVVMVDVDHFKPYNDLHGHAEGDRALTTIARILQKGLRRAADGAYRYGGEEFVLVLPGTTAAAATAVAERLRIEVKHAAASGLTAHPVTASFGVASQGPARRGAAELLAAADAELYRAKRFGRDRTETCPDDPGSEGGRRQAG
jgi:diguanylate cyclase (GGDEF)-like protein